MTAQEIATQQQATEDRERAEFANHPAYKWATHSTSWSHDQKAAFAVWCNGRDRHFDRLSVEFHRNYWDMF